MSVKVLVWNAGSPSKTDRSYPTEDRKTAIKDTIDHEKPHVVLFQEFIKKDVKKWKENQRISGNYKMYHGETYALKKELAADEMNDEIKKDDLQITEHKDASIMIDSDEMNAEIKKDDLQITEHKDACIMIDSVNVDVVDLEAVEIYNIQRKFVSKKKKDIEKKSESTISDPQRTSNTEWSNDNSVKDDVSTAGIEKEMSNIQITSKESNMQAKDEEAKLRPQNKALKSFMEQNKTPDSRMCLKMLEFKTKPDMKIMFVSWHGLNKLKEAKPFYFEYLMEFLRDVKEKYNIGMLVGGDFNVDRKKIEKLVPKPFKLCDSEKSPRRKNDYDFYIVSEDLTLQDITWVKINTEVRNPDNIFDHDPVAATLLL